MSQISISKKILYACAILVTFCCILVALSEFYLRKFPPKYPVQVFRQGKNLSISATESGVFWHNPNAIRFKTGCRNIKDPIVLLQGSSILYGSATDAEEAFGFWIAEELKNLRGHSVCVLNQAIPGFTFSSQYAFAQTLSPTIKPTITLWELWHNTPHQFIKIGSAVYNFGSQDPHYVPDPFFLGTLNKRLLTYSRSYEFLVFHDYKAQNTEINKWNYFVEHGFPKMQAWARQRETKLMLASFPSANQPFSKQIIDHSNSYGIIAQHLRDSDVPLLDITSVLEDKRDQLFADSCCHYNALGTRTVSKVIAQFIHQHWPEE